MLGEWTGATVEPGDGKPAPDMWTPVEVPGRPSVLSGADAAAYRVEFDDPREGGDELAALVLRGLYAHARVWLNDELVGEHDSYLAPFRHTFEPQERNELVVECRAPEDRFGGIHDTDRIPEADAVPGIWWGADLESQPSTFIADLVARPRVTDGNAKIDVRAVVDADRDVDDRMTFSLRPEGEFKSRGMMDRASVRATAGERAVVNHTIDVHDPELWWPRSLGQQHRYTVRAKLDGNTRTVTTGLCSVSRDEDGLRVNGKRVPVRGVNLLSATPDDVDRALEANATLVRMHAHGAPPEVYDACDEAGLLVWQDMPLTGPGGFDVERGQRLATDLVRTYGRHPSLASFSVHDDPVELFPNPLGSGSLDRMRLRWRTWRASYDRNDADAVAEALPSNRPVFPVVGPLGTGADATTLYPGWDYGEADDTEWLLEKFGIEGLDGVVAEFGAGALGAVDTGDVRGFDRAKHDAHADDVESSQRHQATVLKRVAETLRRHGVGLFAAFALRDAAEAGPGVLERDGSEKAGFQALAASYEPVQAMLADPTAGAMTDLEVHNETAAGIQASVEWTAGTVTDNDEVAVDPHTTETVTTVSVPTDAERATLRLSFDDRTVENTYYL